MIGSLNDLQKKVSVHSKKRVVLAEAQDVYALEAVCEAASLGLIEAVLVGESLKIKDLIESLNYDVSDYEIIDESDLSRAVEIAVRIIRQGQGEVLMKGSCSTATLLKGVLNKEWGLRQGDLLSHFALFETSNYHKLLGVSDVAINIAPGLDQKASILANAVGMLSKLGIEEPKIALIAAVETVSDQMQATTDAVKLMEMGMDQRFRTCLIKGPLALDTAISAKSAQHKGIQDPVAGDADFLLMPNIETGNVFYKTMTYLAQSRVASVVLGASAPVVLTSRSDSHDTKLNSILLGCLDQA